MRSTTFQGDMQFTQNNEEFWRQNYRLRFPDFTSVRSERQEAAAL